MKIAQTSRSATSVEVATVEESSVGIDTATDLLGISVIVPVRNDPQNLELCLRALRSSEYPELEIIVVDDGSTDDTAQVARSHGVRLFQNPQRQGPAVARNVGADKARHPILLFIDADVCVRPDTLSRAAASFRADPDLTALFGSYDESPGAPNVVSQYRNLMHHYVHQESREEAWTFWSGCGAIRREVFLEIGGFDPDYGQASIEDIELGSRLRRAGHRVVIAKDLQVKHMKRWTLLSMIRCDVLQRGIPWTLLLLREGRFPDDMNLKLSQRLSALLAGGLIAALAAGSWYYRSLLLVPLVGLLGFLALDHFANRRPVPRWGRYAAGLTLLATLGAMVATSLSGQTTIELWSLLAGAFLLGIVLLNLRFYLFYARVKRPLFVPVVIPLHVLFFLYSGLAFAAGFVLHLWQTLRPAPRPRWDQDT